MRTVINKYKKLLGALVLLTAIGACNKQYEDIGADIPATIIPTGATLNDVINTDTSYSFFKALVARAGAGAPTAALSNQSLRFTAFIPKNAAFQAAGIPSALAVPSVFSVAQATGIVNYVITPQLLRYEDIPGTFPNLIAPTLLNPTAGTAGFNPLVSLSIFPSKRGSLAWVNNVPLSSTSTAASNGIILNPVALVIPPSATLWSRISTDADMTYFKAAIQRGDSGSVGTARFDSLLNLPVGPNFTVFVPTNAAMQAALTAQITAGLIPVVTAQLIPIITAQLIPVITAQLIAGGATPAQAAAQAPILAAQQAPALAAAQAPAIALGQATMLASSPAVFSNPQLFPVLTPTVVKGIVVYHLLGAGAFTVNLPTTPTFVPTLLNTVVPTHPGVKVGATFTGPVVTAATVQGAANATASSILINPTPNPGGTSDQFFTNGVLHKINQVLLPQ